MVLNSLFKVVRITCILKIISILDFIPLVKRLFIAIHNMWVLNSSYLIQASLVNLEFHQYYFL